MKLNSLTREAHVRGISSIVFMSLFIIGIATKTLLPIIWTLFDNGSKLVEYHSSGVWQILGYGIVLFLLVLFFILVYICGIFIKRYIFDLLRHQQPQQRDTTHGSAHWAELPDVIQAGLAGAHGIPMHEFSINEGASIGMHYASNQHLLTIAPTRSGKGVSSIIPTLLEYEGSMLVIDPKGQNAAVTSRHRREVMGQEVVILNPFDTYGLPSSSVNPLSILDPDSPDVVRDVATLAEALIVYGGQGDSHWADSARELIQALLLDIITDPALGPETRNLETLRMRLTKPRKAFGEHMAGLGTRSTLGKLLAVKAGRFQDAESKEIGSIISTAITQTAVFDFPQLQDVMSSTDFDFADLKKRPTTVYLILPVDALVTCGRWLRLMITLAIRAMSRTAARPNKPVLFLLDEFAALGHLEVVENAVGLMAGYGMQLWPIVQDIPQLKTLYSARWESFLANAGVIDCFRTNDMETAEYISRRIGQMTVNTSSNSTTQTYNGGNSTSWSYGTAARPLMQANEVMVMPDERAIIFAQGAPPIWALRTPYYKDSKYTDLYDEDPAHPKTDSALPAEGVQGNSSP